MVNTNNLKILFVEDEELSREFMVLALNRRGFKNVYLANDGYDGINKYLDLKPDVVITDIWMPGINGVEFSNEIKKINSLAKIIFVSSDTKLPDEIKKGITVLFNKPINYDSLSNYIKGIYYE